MPSSTRIPRRNLPLTEAKRDLEKLRDKLQDLNSQYPATRQFLYSRGLKHVSELDAQGMKDLREYLTGEYKKLLH
jgi:hypothetical protein